MGFENFYKFIIIKEDDGQAAGPEYEEIMINAEQIVSIKKINIVQDDKITKGLWVRTTNGKKYRAVSGPEELFGKASKQSNQQKQTNSSHLSLWSEESSLDDAPTQ